MIPALESDRKKREEVLPPEQEVLVQELESIFYPGSFLLSVQSLFGHMLVGLLTARYYESRGIEIPNLPKVVYQTLPARDIMLPGGHAPVVDKTMQVAGLWYSFLRCAVPPAVSLWHNPEIDAYYRSRKTVDDRQLVRELIEVIAESDRLYVMPYKYAGTGSKISQQFGPSLLKSLIIQDRFPKGDSRFYNWLIPEMRSYVMKEKENGLDNLREVKNLSAQWDQYRGSTGVSFFEE